MQDEPATLSVFSNYSLVWHPVQRYIVLTTANRTLGMSENFNSQKTFPHNESNITASRRQGTSNQI